LSKQIEFSNEVRMKKKHELKSGGLVLKAVRGQTR